MARHKNTERGIRKLTRLGDSYAITLPIDLIRELSWREKQKVEVVRRGKTLVVRDWE
jgi:antitoxin component of MazEF toxin-antitoxin module